MDRKWTLNSLHRKPVVSTAPVGKHCRVAPTITTAVEFSTRFQNFFKLTLGDIRSEDALQTEIQEITEEATSAYVYVYVNIVALCIHGVRKLQLKLVPSIRTNFYL